MLGEFSCSITDCATTEGVGAVFHRAVEREGYTASACRVLRNPGQWHNSFRNWPESWVRLSDTKHFAARSVVLDEARQRIAPFTWKDVRTSRAPTSAAQEMWDAAASWGWFDGFVVPVHGPNGYFACISMASPEQNLDRCAETRIRLQMFALIAHERCLALSGSSGTADPRQTLSARELECLRWVGAGKTDWEIGMILGIAASTVKFHVDRARDKLGTRTRAHAVARLGPQAW